MSAESRVWLNKNVLVGATDKRGNAWHFDPSLQGEELNHYPGFIPVADVERRLFSFEAEELQAAYLRRVASPAAGESRAPNVIVLDGAAFEVVADPEHKAVVDGDTGVVFNYPTTEWKKHTFSAWLLREAELLLDTPDLGITSAGLLRRRAQAWVEISIPDSIETPEGVTFRPNLLSGTSYDSSLASFRKRTIGLVVCDNTLHAACRESGEEIRIKHTSGSRIRIGEARQALNLIFKQADEFSAKIHALCAETVTEQQWQDVLSALFPYPEKASVAKPGRSWTRVDNKHAKLDQLYHFDPRCAPWQSTAFGVLQTCNTWKLHEATIHNTTGGGRFERNQLNVINGRLADFDTSVLTVLGNVLDKDLIAV